ncbi:MAG TPA: hypothetical protein DEO60_16225 [Bacteroidales bacterium]|jgi:hypothetical protein|nr:hypothetical protein [Bacteroidales bacterium]HBZ22682.1 hypothetical protein [Bacteroidales bacterium]
MRKVLIAILLLSSSFVLPGQSPFPTPGEIKQFNASKTCVVLEDGNTVYNTYIRQAMNEYWKITPFEFIKTSDFGTRRTDPACSFIILTETNYENDKSKSVFNFINLLQGKNINELGKMPEICAVPLSFAGEDDMEYGYKLGAILAFMQKHAQMISEDPSLTGRRYLRYYNRNIPEVMTKKILVKQEDLSPAIGTIDKIKAIYRYDIEIVPEEVIVKAIQEKAKNTLILHKVGPVGEGNPGHCFKMLIGTDDSNMYYYNQHAIDKANPNGLLPADLKRLAKF